jgi:hypothetical protein
VALREIAEKTISPEDLKEDLIHSLQKYVEVDEPEPDAPLIGSSGSVDADDTDVALEHMSEEELLKGLEGLAPPEAQAEEEEYAGSAGRGRGISVPSSGLPCGFERPGVQRRAVRFLTLFAHPCGSRKRP